MSDKILYMPAYKAVDDQVDWYAKHTTKWDRQKAALLLHQDKIDWRNNPKTSRVQYDKLTDTWRGRKTYLPREKFGLYRDGSNPNSLRNVLVDAIGERYVCRDEVVSILTARFGEKKAESKFSQARTEGILKHTDGVWYLWTTPPPNREQVLEHAGESKHLLDVKTYGNMPRCLNKPGDVWDPATSEVNTYILAQSGSTDLRKLKADILAMCKLIESNLTARDTFATAKLIRRKLAPVRIK
jgi:hypothetical protein